MGILVQKLTEEQLSDPNYLKYLDGPWRNDACQGYMILAMTDCGFNYEQIETVRLAMKRCFDDYTIEEAAQEYYKF